jgi:hypothetical protein
VPSRHVCPGHGRIAGPAGQRDDRSLSTDLRWPCRLGGSPLEGLADEKDHSGQDTGARRLGPAALGGKVPARVSGSRRATAQAVMSRPARPDSQRVGLPGKRPPTQRTDRLPGPVSAAS